MSFSVSYHARNKAEAKERLAQFTMPECVREFVSQSIDNLPDDGRSVVVSANGHLNVPGTYERSNANIEVYPSWPMA